MIERYDDLATAVMSAPARLGQVRLVAVDGPAGSGKSTFSGRLVRGLRSVAPRVAEIHTDDLLEGWTDLVSCWPRLDDWIRRPLRRGEPGRYRRYDWHRGCFAEVWELLPVPDVLVLEGVASARSAASSDLSLAVFVEAERDLRLRRGLERDGEALRDRWLRWMADEDRHFGEDGTAGRAGVLVDGAPAVAHRAEEEFVRLG
jgi:hypothetical protein